MDALIALSLADDIRGSYPGRAVSDAHVQRWADELRHMTEREARRVVEIVTARSVDPPSRAALRQVLAEVQQQTMSPAFDWRLCTYLDGVKCDNCGEIHGHLMDPGQVFHGAYHLGRHLDGIADELEAAKRPEECSCGFDGPPNVDPERVVHMVIEGMTSRWAR